MHSENTSTLIPNWKAGIDAFNSRDYWQAHDHWEQGWKNLPPLQKHYVQGLIQAAAVFHLLGLGRVEPAERLRRSALGHFSQADAFGSYPADEPRIEIAGLRECLASEKRLTIDSAKELQAVLL